MSARTAAAILAGGRASRLGGVAKPLLTVGGQRIIDRALAVLRPLVDEVVILADDAAPFAPLGLRVIPDRRPGLGPLAGLEAALLAVDAEELLLVGGDMPALSPRVVAHVLAAAPGADAVVPFTAGRPEPLHARYHRRVAATVSARLDRGALPLHGLLDEIAVTPVDEAALRALDPELLTFANVNTPDDLRRLDERLRGGAANHLPARAARDKFSDA
jgi:molybdenum cofactor guanylyltransferase